MATNIFERGVVSEIHQVIAVEPPDTEEGGVHVEYGPIGGTVGTVHTWDRRFTPEDVEPGDIVKIDFKGPSVGMITEIFREGFQVFPTENPEQLQVLKAHIASRRSTQTQAGES